MPDVACGRLDAEEIQKPFNSLFEMRLCLAAESGVEIVKAFNSLFEMQKATTAAARPSSSLLPFNSLFEMP